MIFAPGTGGTITATTLENQWFTLLSLIQQTEKDPTKNLQNQANIVSSSIDQDTYILSGSASIYCQLVRDGISDRFTYPDPYVGEIFVEGTGGNGTATALINAFVQRTRWIMMAERSEEFNPNSVPLKFTGVQWELLDAPLSIPVNHNATFNFNFNNLNLKTVSTGNGSTFTLVPWLSGDVADL